MSTTPETLESPESGLEPRSGEMALDSGPDHMMNFRAPELGDQGGAEDDMIDLGEDGQPIGQIDTQEAVEMMTKDAFYVVFRHAFGLPGMFMPQWRPLAIQPSEETIARDACDAIYELLEIYYPGALMPQGDTFARIATAAPFVLAKVLVVREILRARRARVVSEDAPEPPAGEFRTTRTETPANDNVAPTEGDPTTWMNEEAAA